MKSTVQQIRERFDNDVERFSKLETGNTAQVDSLLSLELIADAAATTNADATTILDVGCGAGNYVLKILQRIPNLNVTLIDLSKPMLQRASERVSQVTSGKVQTIQADIREAPIGEARYQIIVAAAVLHHLRSDEEWEFVFTKLYRALVPNGTLWIYDLIQHAIPEIEGQMAQRYSRYLTALKDDAYRDQVLGWIEQEDTPRSLVFQIDLLRTVGFREIDVLHKNMRFAAFGARK